MIKKKMSFCTFFLFILISTSCFGYYFSLNVQELTSATVINPAVATNSSGQYVYAVYVKSNNCYAEISADYGNPTSWTTVTLDTLSVSGDAKIAVSSDGSKALAIWNTSGNTSFSFTNDAGSTWNLPIEVLLTTSSQLAMDDSGLNAYISSILNNQIYVTRIVNGSYISETALTTSGTISISPQITTDSTGQYVYVILKKTSAGTIEIYRSNDYGGSYILLYSQSEPTAESPQITTSSNGKYLYFTYKKDASSIVRGFSSDYGIGPTKASVSANSNSSPQIAIDSSGKFAYNIFKGSSGSIDLYITNNYGASWNLVSLNQTGDTPNITNDISGRYIITSFNNSGVPYFYYSQDWGSTWSLFINPSTPTVTDKEAPTLASSEDGQHFYGIWTATDDSLQLGLFRRTFVPIPPFPTPPYPITPIEPNKINIIR